MIQTRRSVSSSPSSESENNDIHNENKHQKIAMQTTNTSNIETSSTEMDRITSTASTGTYEANENMVSLSQLGQFNVPNENGPVSLFPPTSGPSLSTQIPFPSPGAAMFPPTFVNAFSASTSTANTQPISKHENTITPNSAVTTSINHPSNLCAAFTSSSHNLSLTTTIMPLSPVPSDVSSITSLSRNNLLTPVSTHISASSNNNNNNNNISNSNSNKINFNRKYSKLVKNYV